MSEIASVGHGMVGMVGRVTERPMVEGSSHLGRTAPSVRGVDRADVSDHARLLERLQQMPDVRAEHVEAIREAIRNDTYLTDERLSEAVDHLMSDLLD